MLDSIDSLLETKRALLEQQASAHTVVAKDHRLLQGHALTGCLSRLYTASEALTKLCARDDAAFIEQEVCLSLG